MGMEGGGREGGEGRGKGREMEGEGERRGGPDL